MDDEACGAKVRGGKWRRRLKRGGGRGREREESKGGEGEESNENVEEEEGDERRIKERIREGKIGKGERMRGRKED